MVGFPQCGLDALVSIETSLQEFPYSPKVEEKLTKLNLAYI